MSEFTPVLCPTGWEYKGEWFEKLNCAVSILRSGEISLTTHTHTHTHTRTHTHTHTHTHAHVHKRMTYMYYDMCGMCLSHAGHHDYHPSWLPGEAMEKGLRDCCRSMRIGKILIRRDQETRKPKASWGRRQGRK